MKKIVANRSDAYANYQCYIKERRDGEKGRKVQRGIDGEWVEWRERS